MPLPLLTLLSQPLVAFVIELDNEFEHRMPHRTTDRGLAGSARLSPWLTSFAMYANCLQFLGEVPISVGDVARQARMSTNLDGMRRWGYVRLSPDPAKPTKKPDERWLMEATAAGRLARETWRPLPALIEERWRDRFGSERISALREALLELNRGFDVAYPDFLPILGYGLFTRGGGPGEARPMPPASEAVLGKDAPLTTLFSRALCAFTYEFEAESALSLAISANLVSVLGDAGIRNRDLPQRTGVSKESISMALGILRKANVITIGSGAGKSVSLNARGLAAQETAGKLIADIERRWRVRFGEHIVARLRGVLEPLAGEPGGEASPLLQGLEPYPDNWRASVPKVLTLPGFPMVLHRGGYPDGS